MEPEALFTTLSTRRALPGPALLQDICSWRGGEVLGEPGTPLCLAQSLMHTRAQCTWESQILTARPPVKVLCRCDGWMGPPWPDSCCQPPLLFSLVPSSQSGSPHKGSSIIWLAARWTPASVEATEQCAVASSWQGVFLPHLQPHTSAPFLAEHRLPRILLCLEWVSWHTANVSVSD